MGGEVEKGTARRHGCWGCASGCSGWAGGCAMGGEVEEGTARRHGCWGSRLLGLLDGRRNGCWGCSMGYGRDTTAAGAAG